MYQKLTIVGNLGGDPEMRYTPSGQAVTNFRVATNRRWVSNDGQPQEETTWFRVTVWGKQAETCNQYLNKGRQVLIEGRLKPEINIWTGQDGKPHATYEVTAYEVRFLGGRGGDNGGSVPAGAADEPGLTEDEIPF